MEGWERMEPSVGSGWQDTEATCTELARRGVTFTQAPTKMRWGTFADLDANEFLLTEGP